LFVVSETWLALLKTRVPMKISPEARPRESIEGKRAQTVLLLRSQGGGEKKPSKGEKINKEPEKESLLTRTKGYSSGENLMVLE